jgi:uncharacterized protein (TIGR02117 family)
MLVAATGTGVWRPLRMLARGVLALLLIPILYGAAAVVLGLIPVNADFRPADAGVAIYVRANGVHTDIVVPHIHRLHDWRAEFPQSESALWRRYVVFSWGDRGFFQETPRWRDLRASVAFVALSGLGRAAMRVEFTDTPLLSDGDASLRLSDDQYSRLVQGIRTSFQRSEDGRPQPVPTPPYAARAFYFEAQGSYSLVYTCNDWTRTRLTEAGVRMPVWAPFYPAIIYQLRQVARAPDSDSPWAPKIEERQG